MTDEAAGASPHDRGVGRLEPERASECGLTECAGKPMCPRCARWKARDDGMPGDPDERYLRRLLAANVGVPATYYDDGEAFAQAPEFGITIDFMREPVADIDAKIRALNVARAERELLAFDPTAGCSPTLTQCPRCKNPHHACDGGKTPNVRGNLDPTARGNT